MSVINATYKVMIKCNKLDSGVNNQYNYLTDIYATTPDVSWIVAEYIIKEQKLIFLHTAIFHGKCHKYYAGANQTWHIRKSLLAKMGIFMDFTR